MSDDRDITYKDTFGGSPVIVYRASAIGGCVRALVASRLGYKPAPHPPELLEAFDRGNKAEPLILAYLQSHGWNVDGEQREINLRITPSIIVRGHVDGVGAQLESPSDEQELIECKYMGRDSFTCWTQGQLSNFPRYQWQTDAYCHGLGLASTRICIATPRDEGKEGEVDFHVSPSLKPKHSLGAIRQRIIKIERLVKEESLPDCEDKSGWGCPFYYLHEDGILPFADDKEQKIIDKILILQDKQGEYSSLIDKEKAKLIALMKSNGRDKIHAAEGVSVSIVVPSRIDYRRAATKAGLDLSEFKTVGKEYVRITRKKENDGRD